MVSRPAMVLGTLWVGGAVFATSVGLVAVERVGNEVGGPVSSPLTSDAIHEALVAASPAPEHTEAADTDGVDELGAVETVSSRGGVLGARCRDHLPTLLYATPTDGYRTVRSSGLVRFVGSRNQVVVRLSCNDEDLVARTTVQRLGTPVATPSPAPAATREPAESQDSPSASPEPSHSSSDDGSEDH